MYSVTHSTVAWVAMLNTIIKGTSMTTPTKQSPWISSKLTFNIEINAWNLGIDGVSDFDHVIKQVIADAIAGMTNAAGLDPEVVRTSYIHITNATYTRGTDDIIPYTTKEYD